MIAARAVKEINPQSTILYYRNVLVHYGGYEADKGLRQIPGAMLLDQNGSSKLVRNRVEAYDLSSADLRAWWVKSCSSVTADPAIDGIFLDGNIKALEPGYLTRQIGTAKKKQTMDGYHLLMKQTREAIGPDKLMVANILRARFQNAGLEYLDYFDGSYLEGFFHNVGGASYEEYVAKGIDAMQKAARQGKIIAFTTGFASPGNLPGNTSEMGIDEAHAGVVAVRAFDRVLDGVVVAAVVDDDVDVVAEGLGRDAFQRAFEERRAAPPRAPALRIDRSFRYEASVSGAKFVGGVDVQNRGWKHRLSFGGELSRQEVNELRDGLQTSLPGLSTTRSILGETFPLRDFPNSRIVEAGVFVFDEMQRAGSPWSFSPALRIDHYRLTPTPDAIYLDDNPAQTPVRVRETSVSPRLGATYRFGGEYVGFGQYTHGFRSPPFEDVNIGLDLPQFLTRAVPNPDLRPETSDHFEVGLRIARPRVSRNGECLSRALSGLHRVACQSGTRPAEWLHGIPGAESSASPHLGR
ncbi:MAG: TonB-dependent receptor [Rhodobacteraceae bacterium]|nr:TonB-dependent receptor [Paracoccaceae bacterium]